MPWKCPACGNPENLDDSLRCSCEHEIAEADLERFRVRSAGAEQWLAGMAGSMDHNWSIASTDGTAAVAVPAPPAAAKPKRSGIIATLAVAGAVVLKFLKPLLIGLKFFKLGAVSKDVRIEAWTAMAGPLVGTGGAIVCCAVAIATGNPFWLAAAYSGFFLNLFNLIPLSPLDGGRVVAAISPKLWILGFVGVLLLFLRSWNPILFLILIPAGRNVYNLWKTRGTPQEEYYAIDRKTKVRIAVVYFALLAFLPLAMALTHVQR